MLTIHDPFHGAVINHRWGQQSDAGLTLRVTGHAPRWGVVTVNGIEAATVGDRFECPVTITQAEQDITAVYEGAYGHQEHTVRVVWDRYSKPRYRFSIDDNSFWLRDVAQHGYESLFDCFYLDILRKLNTEYGAKFTLNIYFSTADGFELTEFPDRYKSEFENNADWMVLAFHARANDPDRLYQYAAAETLMDDLHRVEEQVLRFAGEATLAPPTVIHWGMVQPAALPALYEHGVRVLSGFFGMREWGSDVNYMLDPVRSENVFSHEALKDFRTGLLFSRVDIVCNNTPVEQVESVLQPLYENPLQAEVMDLFTHEQYFWPFYTRYIPDHGERLDAAIRWVTERGYEPVFFHEGFMGAKEPG